MKLDALPQKYQDALTLIEAGDLSYRDIAIQCGISPDTLYDLIEGKPEKYGNVGVMFCKELDAVYKRIDKDIRKLTKKNKKSTQYLLDQYLSKVKTRKSLSKDLVHTVVSITNALAKSTPKVEIGSFSYSTGISAEELVYEFKRLKGTGEMGPNRTGIPELVPGGQREIPVVEGPSSSIDEESENPLLPTEP